MVEKNPMEKHTWSNFLHCNKSKRGEKKKTTLKYFKLPLALFVLSADNLKSWETESLQSFDSTKGFRL